MLSMWQWGRRARRLGAVAAVMTGLAAGGSAAFVAATGSPSAAQAGACTDSWTGAAGDGQWTTAGNWSTGDVPGAADTACITTTGAAVQLAADSSTSVTSVVVGAGTTLTLENGASITVTDLFDNQGTLAVDTGSTAGISGAVTNEATADISLTDTSSLDLTGSDFTDEGNLTVEISSATTFGTVVLDPTSTAALSGPINPTLVDSFVPTADASFEVLSGPYTGSFSAVSNDFSADNGTDEVSVVAGNATTTTVTTSTSSTTYGTPLTVTATVTYGPWETNDPTGTVTFTTGGTTLGSQALSTTAGVTSASTTVTPPVGTDPVTASYPGDTNFAGSSGTAATPVTVSTAPTTTTLTTSANPSPEGSPLTLTATITTTSTIGSPTGSVAFDVGATELAAVPVTDGTASLTTSVITKGKHDLTAVYSGDANFSTSTSPAVKEKIVSSTTSTSLIKTSTTLTSSANPSSAGSSVTFTATVTPDESGPAAPTGSVAFILGKTTLGTSPLSSDTAAVTLSSLAAGSRHIKAVYSGDTNYATSKSHALDEKITKPQSSTSVFVSLSATTQGREVTLSVAVTSTNGIVSKGKVAVYNGSSKIFHGKVSSSGTAVFSTSKLPLGPNTITATFKGGHNLGSTSAPVVVQVDPVVYAASLFPAAVLDVDPTAGSDAPIADGTTKGGTSTGPDLVATNPDGTAIYTLTNSSNDLTTLAPTPPKSTLQETPLGYTAGSATPVAIGVTHNGKQVAVAVSSTTADLNELVVISAKSLDVTASVPLPGQPAGLAIHGNKAYVSVNESTGAQLVLVNLVKGAASGAVSLGSSATVGPVAISPDATPAYVVAEGSGVDVVNLAKLKDASVTGTDTLTGTVDSLAMSPDGTTLYAATVSSSGNSVQVVDATDGDVTATVPMSGIPYALGMQATGATVYVADGTGVVSLNTSTDATTTVKGTGVEDVASPS